jgi:hypothetical protein
MTGEMDREVLGAGRVVQSVEKVDRSAPVHGGGR